MLPQRPLGKTGINVSCLGLGTVKFGRTHNLRYTEKFSLPDDAQLKQLLEVARECGINLLDTAPAYGFSEERLGDLIKLSRKDWIISTKAGEEFILNKATDEAWSQFDFSAKNIRASVERSLRRLRTDYLDLVLIHSDGEDEKILTQTDALDTLIQLKREGWIRAHGISSKTVAGGVLAAELMDAVMLTYNQQQPEELEVINACAKSGTGVLLKKVFASGQVCHHTPPGAQKQIQSALEFALKPQAVSSAVLGTINPQHLRENVLAVLAADKLARLHTHLSEGAHQAKTGQFVKNFSMDKLIQHWDDET
jgi:aryl-alcohol dehydrogenase-like predicted oxidoreductase